MFAPHHHTRNENLVAVVVGLVRPFLGYADVRRLLVGQCAQLRIQRRQLQARHLFVQMLGQGVNADRIILGAGEQLDLRDGLVGER